MTTKSSNKEMRNNFCEDSSNERIDSMGSPSEGEDICRVEHSTFLKENFDYLLTRKTKSLQAPFQNHFIVPARQRFHDEDKDQYIFSENRLPMTSESLGKMLSRKVDL